MIILLAIMFPKDVASNMLYIGPPLFIDLLKSFLPLMMK